MFMSVSMNLFVHFANGGWFAGHVENSAAISAASEHRHAK